MPGDIGPGPLRCIEGIACNGCGESVTTGALYHCEELQEASWLILAVFGPCDCGQDHPDIILRGKKHSYCPRRFVPLNDPDATIAETSEPTSTKIHPMHRVKEPQNV